LRGDDDSAIKKTMVEKYGTTVLAAPTTSGFNIVAWITPFVIFVLALGAVVYVVRTWKKRNPPPPPGPPTGGAESLDSYRELARKETEL
jgi:cytochrome c-type biogenesis protein CcmH